MRLLLVAAGLLGGGLLVAADFSTLYEVDVLTVAKTSVSGHVQHGYALAVLGLGALPVGLAAVGGRRSAMLALGALGLLGLAVAAITGDFHDVRSTGLVGQLYESATVSPKRGFYLETAGGALLVVGGFGLLLLPHGRADPPARSSRRPAAGAREAGDRR